MSDENSTATVPTPDSSNSPSDTAPPPPSSPTQDREELLSRARNFLASPQIAQQDVEEKRRFLAEKGLNDSEIDSLLRELPLQRPTIPPRTYPQPPPSNLPTLLLGLFRMFSWIVGGSAVLVFIYHRFLLPRIIRTTIARQSLKLHQVSLIRRLNTSLASFKDAQAETYKFLPRPDYYKEPPEFQKCFTVADILAVLGDEASPVEDVPSTTLLRCGLADFGRGKEGDLVKPTTEEIFEYLESRIPWLKSDEGLQYEDKLWQTLQNCPLFDQNPSPALEGTHTGAEGPTRWSFVSPTPPESSPVMKSLNALAKTMPKKPAVKQSPFQHTLQALSDLTGYLTTQIYMPYRTPSSVGGYLNAGSVLGPAEEEFKKEIRALKGLVLNRRSFVSSIPSSTLSTP